MGTTRAWFVHHGTEIDEPYIMGAVDVHDYNAVDPCVWVPRLDTDNLLKNSIVSNIYADPNERGCVWKLSQRGENDDCKAKEREPEEEASENQHGCMKGGGRWTGRP